MRPIHEAAAAPLGPGLLADTAGEKPISVPKQVRNTCMNEGPAECRPRPAVPESASDRATVRPFVSHAVKQRPAWMTQRRAVAP